MATLGCIWSLKKWPNQRYVGEGWVAVNWEKHIFPWNPNSLQNIKSLPFYHNTQARTFRRKWFLLNFGGGLLKGNVKLIGGRPFKLCVSQKYLGRYICTSWRKKNELRQVHPIIKKLTYLSEFVITKGSLSCSYYLLHAIMLKYKDILDNIFNKELKESASNSRIYMTSNSQGTEEVGK